MIADRIRIAACGAIQNMDGFAFCAGSAADPASLVGTLRCGVRELLSTCKSAPGRRSVKERGSHGALRSHLKTLNSQLMTLNLLLPSILLISKLQLICSVQQFAALRLTQGLEPVETAAMG